MDTNRKQAFLVNVGYWGVIILAAYLVLEYLVPVLIPFIIGAMVSSGVVWLSQKIPAPQKPVRLLLTALIYGVIALVITLLAAKGVAFVYDIVVWLQELYEMKLIPLVSAFYDGFTKAVGDFDPALISALSMIRDGILSALKNLITTLSGSAVGLVSDVATGIPTVIISILAMIFSTVFLVGDYEQIHSFIAVNLTPKAREFIDQIRRYLTETLFVVIRSYCLIMLLTFTELSILFFLFGIENGMLKAALIAVFDILPILGVGGILIPWAVISLVLGYTKLGISLFIIYGIVTVVRNYVEPKIVGAQLGLHPIITLTSMFVGLNLFGFLGLFGFPVAISFFWKLKKERDAVAQTE